jgi:poly(A) polymerase Pap1
MFFSVATPAFPAMNSTHNVSECTRKIITEEICRGQELFAKGKQEGRAFMEIIGELVQPYPLFDQHRNYLELQVLAKSKAGRTKNMGLIDKEVLWLRHMSFNHLHMFVYSFKTRELRRTCLYILLKLESYEGHVCIFF